ncbi:CDP-diacylglycerol--serine O-phosphatidyltransferase [hydrothermal vent metagenome]|uniref:CDP-diacylglycerol--serine O-phosphatidyltransferase n=1 Tax=hydrothermal vent metagenome TaxID=652676 RepID=A0A3B0TV98_9ZZZZ
MAANKNIISWIPNFITSLNIFSGMLATIFAIDGQLGWAGLFICVAAVFDFLDGFSARLLKAYSQMGKELDSLADVISFGIAPGAILFTLLEYALFGINRPIHEITASWGQWLVLSAAALIPIFSALRLARFNIDTTQVKTFTGLPTPANAILWASFGLMLEYREHIDLIRLVFTTKNLLIITFITSFLLISGIPMFSLKFSNYSIKGNWYRYLFLIAGTVLLLLLKVYAIPIIIALYIASSFIFYLARYDLD